MQQQPSSLRIIMMGQVMVNLPITLVMVMSILVLYYIGLPIILAGLASTLIGWLAWSKALGYWKNWALSRNVGRERLFRLGRLGLINFYRYRIFDSGDESN